MIETPSLTALIVEDDPDFAAYMAAVLRREGFHTTAVTTLREARTAVYTNRFSLITLDLDLGGESGGELLLEIREDPDLASTPLIVVSGLRPSDSMVQGLVEAFTSRTSLKLPDAFLEKPAHPARIRQAVALAIGSSRPEQEP